MLFSDRNEAGRTLAAALSGLRGEDCVVLALPRGGVPVAAPIARELNAPLDLLLVRKIGAPRQPELAIGSVVDGGAPIVVEDAEMMAHTGTTAKQFRAICERELAEIERRRKFYLGKRPPPELKDKTVIVVDDGLATGNTMLAALASLKQRQPARIMLAVPVAPRETLARFKDEVDGVVCLATPEPFGSVGAYYGDFEQVSDAEVIALLERSATPRAA